MPSISATSVPGRIGCHTDSSSGGRSSRSGLITLDGDLPERTVEGIRDALSQYKVLFFRGQDHLDDSEQEAFAGLLGEVVAHPTIPSLAGTAAILELDAAHGGGRVNYWHTDMTFLDAYPQASILRAVKVPSRGGDTVWANTAAAYLDLPKELRTLADRLWGLHTNAYDYATVRPHGREADRQHHAEVFTSTVFETEHPVVRVLSETGERSLVLGGFLQKLVGYSQADSANLVAILQSHVTRLENTARWRWAEGDVAIWDNRATQHYAINDYGKEPRTMRRVTVAGDVPVSVGGRRSVTRKQPTTVTVSVSDAEPERQRVPA
jgi:alpha-ketoglutarate-dependent sulfate ester dioxygenase